ncbi:MAG TPA: MFS transporter [Streptosporangiaceae bacterium]|nr:MFS transporter [Streptosporangiaceae bacterium]
MTQLQPKQSSHPHRWAVLALVLAAECMDLLDGTIVNVAAPTIRADLRASGTALQWIIGGYALAFAVGLITGARLGDRYGRKRMFVLGALGFVATSLLSAFAVSPAMLIGSRLAQGLSAALLIPQGLGIIREVFAPGDQGAAFGVFGPVIGLSAVLGPIIGGALVDLNAFGTGWRLIFFVNLPLGLVAAIGAARLMPESKAPGATGADWVGTLLAAAAMGLLVYPLIQGRQAGWPTWTYAMMAASVAAFCLLVAWSRRQGRRGRATLIEASVLRHRAYSAGLVCIIVFFAGMMGVLLVLTLFLQFGEHFSAIHAGLTLAPFAAGSVGGAVLATTVLVPRIGRATLQVAATVIAAGTCWLYFSISAHGLNTSSVDLIPAQLVLGLGIGMVISPLFDFILAAVTDAEVGSASGVVNAMQQLAGAIGVAVVGTVFFSVLGRQGFVPAIERCLLIELGIAPGLALLAWLLPHQPRDTEAVEAERRELPELVSRAAA